MQSRSLWSAVLGDLLDLRNEQCAATCDGGSDGGDGGDGGGDGGDDIGGGVCVCVCVWWGVSGWA